MRKENEMKHITTRQFSVLADCGKIYQFMLDIYERDWRNGVPAPFFEYAFSSFSYWMDITYSYKNRIWEDNGKIVAFCFNESPVTDIYFSLKPGYEELASEMIAYADAHMPIKNGEIQLILFEGQNALMNAAKQAGYDQKSEIWDMQFDFDDELDYPLPEGFHFVSPKECDMDKISKCCWKGFDHEQNEGVWNHQYEQNNYLLEVAPHATVDMAVIIPMKKENMHVMQECGGLPKINWLIWNHFAQFRNIATEDLLRRHCLNCIEEQKHWVQRI